MYIQRESLGSFHWSVPNAPMYDIIWTDLIDCINDVNIWNEAINHIDIFSPNNVILKGIR